MIKVGVYGATGYSGYELVRILLGHPEAGLAFITSETYRGKLFSEVFPFGLDQPLVAMDEAQPEAVEAVFTCLPHTTAMERIARIYRPGLKVIDLSADFRFSDAAEYSRWYNTEHRAPELLAESAYGLPELFREKIRRCNIVGNPGCYPTSALLALAPLASGGLLKDSEVIVDAKSGVSGAGRKADLTSHFVEVNEEITPYKLGRTHRHVGEMESVLSGLAGRSIRVAFTPQLAPFSRGILSTVYVRTDISAGEIRGVLAAAYENEPFVTVLESGEPARLARVQYNNRCVLGVHEIAGTSLVLITSAIDNLVKGAAGQAVQNFNILFGLDETAGLTAPSGRI